MDFLSKIAGKLSKNTLVKKVAGLKLIFPKLGVFLFAFLFVVSFFVVNQAPNTQPDYQQSLSFSDSDSDSNINDSEFGLKSSFRVEGEKFLELNIFKSIKAEAATTPAAGTGTANPAAATGTGNPSGTGTGAILGAVAPGGTIADLNILKIDCLFEGSDCLVPRLTKALMNISVPLAVLVIMWGGYQYFIGGFDGKTNGMNTIRNAIIGLIIVSMANFVVTTLSSGINGGGGGFDGIVTGAKEIIKNLRSLLVSLAAGIAILVIMWGGYKYFFSGIDWQKEDGLNTIRNGVIGLVIVFVGNGLAGTLEQVASGFQNTTTIPQVIEKLLAPLIKSFTDLLFNLAQAMAVLSIVWGGYKYFFKATDIAKKDGMDNIRNGIIGLATVYLAKSIVDLVTKIIPKDPAASSTVGLNINITGVQSFFKFIIGDILVPASTGFAVFFAILGGYYMITASGDDAKFKKGTKALQDAIIGLIILLLSGTIINAIALVFGSGS